LPSHPARNAAPRWCNAGGGRNKTHGSGSGMLHNKMGELMATSEIRTDRDGNKFLVVSYNNQLSNWGECLKAAYNQHPGCKHIPCIAVADTGRFRIGGEPVRKPALEPPETAQGRATSRDHGEGIHKATPKGNSSQKAPKTAPEWEGRWESMNRQNSTGQQMRINYLINNTNTAA
jgi:hypothetical protein